MKQRNIYIVEDHEIMGEMMQEFLTMDPNFYVCGVVKTAEEALEEIPTMDVHLILIDVSLPGMSGIDLVHSIQSKWPSLPTLMFSAHDESNYVERALTAGARGYVLKGNPHELTQAAQNVLEGETYVSPALTRRSM